MWKLAYILSILVSVVILWVFWIVYNNPGPAEADDSSEICRAFSNAAGTNILLGAKVEITGDSKRLGTLLWWQTDLYFRGDSLSERQKQQLRTLAEQIRKDYEHENGGYHPIRLLF
jgi:hypothetical protein